MSAPPPPPPLFDSSRENTPEHERDHQGTGRKKSCSPTNQQGGGVGTEERGLWEDQQQLQDEGRVTSDFDMVDDVPLTPLFIAINEYGTRLGIGHQQGFIVYKNNMVAGGTSGVGNNSSILSASGGDGSAGGFSQQPTEPFTEVIQHRSDKELASVGLLGLLFETHWVGCVGGGTRPMAAEHKLLLFSGSRLHKTIAVSDPIKRVVLASNTCIVLTQTQFVVTNFMGEKLIEQPANGGLHPAAASGLLPTQGSFAHAPSTSHHGGHPDGTAQATEATTVFHRRPPLAVALTHSIVAYPDVTQGHIRLAHFSALAPPLPANSTTAPIVLPARQSPPPQVAPPGDDREEKNETPSAGGGGGGVVNSVLESLTNSLGPSIDAHDNPLSCIAISMDATVVASASSKGTLIRVWKVEDGSKVTEVRNGTGPTVQPIYQLGINQVNHIFCLSGTKLKIFYIGAEATDLEMKHTYLLPEERRVAQNEKSYFSSLAWMNKYFESRWACSETDLPATAFPILHLAHSQLSPQAAAVTSATTSVVAGASSMFWSYAAYATGQQPIGGGEATTQPPPPSTSTTAPSSTVPHPICVEDTMIVWWDKTMQDRSSAAQGASGRYHLTVAAGEAIAMRFEFDAVLGAVHTVPTRSATATTTSAFSTNGSMASPKVHG